MPTPDDPASNAAHVSRLVHRPVQLADLPRVLRLLPPHVAPTAADREAITSLWPALLQHHPSAIQSGVMEDLALPEDERIVGWGATLLLDGAQAQALALHHEPRAHVARRVYAALRDGSLQPPDDRGLGRANAAGELVALVLHFTLPYAGIEDPRLHKIYACAQESFRLHHTGWNWQAVYLENSAPYADVHEASGFIHRRYADGDTLAGLPDALRPVFMGLTRDEARRRLPGTTLRNAFEHEPPRFRFSAQQRRLLWLALFEEADGALMPGLGVSVHGLKKLWRGIYERVEDVAPGFFGDAGAAGDDDGKRGPEKRRQVLAYVRQRLEELRPWIPA